MNDCAFGVDDPQLVRQTGDHVLVLLREGMFKSRKWTSNCHALIADIDPLDHGLVASKALLPDGNLKVLDIYWNPETGSLHFDIVINNVIPKIKSEILSTIVIFSDPLVWTAPVIVVSKILIQHLWL